MSYLRLTLLVCSLALLAAAEASAQVDPWEFEVYPYQTEGAGMIELESLNSVIPNGHSIGGVGTSAGTYPSQWMYRTSFEVTYGLTDHVEAAAYLDLARPNGAYLQYAGSKYRLRGRLFEQGEMPIDMGWYAELEWHRIHQFDDVPLELELRPILEKDFGRVEIDLNPIFEKAIFVGPYKNQGFEFGYVSGVYYNWMRKLSPGLEFYGGIGLIDDSSPLYQQQHYIFPVLRGALDNGIEYNFGPGFGVTGGSDHVITKFNLEFERYIGALFD